jgi:signal transduction histidine kinase
LLSKQGELNMEALDLNQVIHDTVESIRPMAESRQVSLDIRIWPGLPQVLGDRDRISEAIYHLIHNGIKFNNPDGWVRVRCQPTNGDIEIRVQDNGVGVPQDRLDNLWNAFTQMADPLRRGVEGLGLGLALVRYVAVSHGGEVWAESVEGEGSTFGFRIPALKEEAQRISLRSSRQPLDQGLGFKLNRLNGDPEDPWER